MSHKDAKIEALIEKHRGQQINPHYLGFFDCFNRELFYESHDVLEHLWLQVRRSPVGDFYKGLIQLAGAFVHLQKDRLRPSSSLFKLARANLSKFPPAHERLDLANVLALIDQWLHWLEQNDYTSNPLHEHPAPKLTLGSVQK